ncbi:purine/pyrimidine permease [Bacillus sp. REN16]|uniref:purine/pyrimidine permease n=1 Tax=Bacillus sp. REN16 TaxID=2887296 RepID=UPI001E342BBA|nr:purine/pyrimidine permease [Bacillus sp. REN16]MCC3357695.1 purine/pyrimidine permease [Bacillus sp. REN16]
MKVFFSSLQWLAFIIASSIVAPIAIAALYGMDASETASFVSRTFLVLGLSGLVQVYFGHRLPINEGPAGLWWGVFIIYAGLGPTLYGSGEETLRAIEAGILVSGILFMLLSVLGIIDRLSKLFTPVVTGTYLILLSLQLSGSFLNGIFGVGYRGEETVNLKIAGICLFIVLFTFVFAEKGPRVLRQYSVLISLALGWIIFAVFGLTEPVKITSNKLMEVPPVFAFGKPVFDSGMIATSILVTLLLLTNLIASVRVVEQVLQSQNIKLAKTRYRPAGFMAGINQMLAGLFSAVAPVPISGAAGFIATTKINTRLPFIVGSFILVVISFFPKIMNFVSGLPAPIGYATVFIIFANLMLPALAGFENLVNKSQSRMIIVFSLFVGVGSMFVPSSAFQDVPPILTSVLNNGLVLGTVVAILIEQTVTKLGAKKRESA